MITWLLRVEQNFDRLRAVSAIDHTELKLTGHAK